MRHWRVAGGLILDAEGRLLLVCNRRRDGSLDWSPPGGVIEAGEDLLDGLTREVLEETGLLVDEWDGPTYTVEIEAPDLGWVLVVEAHRAVSVAGDVVLADPDGIVISHRYADRAAAVEQLDTAARWVTEPVLDWLHGRHEPIYRYRVVGGRDSMVVTRQ